MYAIPVVVFPAVTNPFDVVLFTLAIELLVGDQLANVVTNCSEAPEQSAVGVPFGLRHAASCTVSPNCRDLEEGMTRIRAGSRTIAELLKPEYDALTDTMPCPILVANPPLMVTFAASDEDHAAVAVTSCEGFGPEPSESYVAVNCCVPPSATLAEDGVTVNVGTGAATVNNADAVRPE